MVDDGEKFNETLSEKEDFYSHLNMEDITDADYGHPKKNLNSSKFSNLENNKFILLLQKGVYHYEYMDDWEKFNKTSLQEREGFYSHINKEDITDSDYAHAKTVCKDFEKKDLGEYHDLYVQSDNYC